MYINIAKNSEFQLKGYKTITKRVINDANRLKFTKRINEINDILRFQATNISEPNLETRYNNYFEQISMVYNELIRILNRAIIHIFRESIRAIRPDVSQYTENI